MFSTAGQQKNLYAILELPNTATADEIHKNYRKLVLKYHPDKAEQNNLDIHQAAEIFKEIRAAYEILNDPAKKQLYDLKINRPNNFFGSTEKFHEFFKKEPIFNHWQKIALRDFYKYGLSTEMLLKLNTNGEDFSQHHYYALRNLMTDRHFLVTQALDEINGLSAEQAAGIEEGLNRQDVIGLNNFWQITALAKLVSQGLTTTMLQKLSKDGMEFGQHHCYALINLVLERHYTIDKALAEIKGLNADQAGGVEDGLNREDVIGLKNFWHITALAELKPKGLTASALQNLHINKFSDSHCYALIYLVTFRNFSVKQALSEIDGLTDTQASGIKEGLNREDILGLDNFWQIKTLEKLKFKGLNAAMLKNMHTIGEFKDKHCYTLIKLVLDRNFSVKQALSEIDGLSPEQIKAVKKGQTREQVLGDKKADNATNVHRF